MDTYRHWLALQRVPGVGNILFKRLIEAYKHPQAVFEAQDKSLTQVEGMSENVAQGIHGFNNFDTVDRELEKMQNQDISLLTLDDPAYPPLLFAIYDPPPVLYVKGNWERMAGGTEPADTSFFPVAVVGTRKPTPYGKRTTEQLCSALTDHGVTIVSGFARGIDGLAHKTALSASGKTLAVLGCGIDLVYPPEHRKLYDDISEHGVILSEFPLGTPPVSHNFPKRNRIISGLSLGCLVIESGLKSGSLITARLALEQGREVFAVPGPIHSEMSEGPHQLIATGAKLVQTVSDILEEICPQYTKHNEIPVSNLPALEAEEKHIFDHLSLEPKHIDLLISESQRSASEVTGILLTLELKGVIRQLAGQYYIRV